MTHVNTISSFGVWPCHLLLTTSNCYISNYGSGTLNIVRIESDGSIGESVQLINYNISPDVASHVHQCVIVNHVCYVVDLGCDKIYQYDVDKTTGLLSVGHHLSPFIQFEKKSGPRHILFHPTISHAYVMCELNSTITVCAVTGSSGDTSSSIGELTILSTISTLRHDETCVDMAGAELQVSACGRYLYASNRDNSKPPNLGRSSIAVFAIDILTGYLSLLQHVNTRGVHPRYFMLSYEGKGSEESANAGNEEPSTTEAVTTCIIRILNQHSNNVVEFVVDQESGHIIEESFQEFTSPSLFAPAHMVELEAGKEMS